MKKGPYRDGRMHVLSRRCSTCVFRPGNLMQLEPGRLQDLIEANRELNTALTCHQTLPYGEVKGVKPSICRGYFDAYWREITPLRMAVALNCVAEDEPPEKEVHEPVPGKP